MPRLLALLHSLRERVIVISPDGVYREVYGKARLEQDDPDAMIGRHMSSGLPPEFAEIHAAPFRRALEGATVDYRWDWPPSSGDLWFDTRVGPLWGDDGTVEAAVSITREVTDLVHAREALETQTARLHELDRLDALGRLAGGVAHSFNNLLTVINGQTELALGEAGISDRARWSLGEIGRAGRMAALITSRLLAFGRRYPGRIEEVDLNAVLKDQAELLEHLMGESVRVMVETVSGPVVIRADRSQIEQAVLNLILNARDAMAGKGELTVATAVASGEVVLSVTDTGKGMTPEVRRRALEPFYSTKDPAGATGLGLSVVNGIVSALGGQVVIVSSPGRGTTVCLRFPRAGRS